MAGVCLCVPKYWLFLLLFLLVWIIFEKIGVIHRINPWKQTLNTLSKIYSACVYTRGTFQWKVGLLYGLKIKCWFQRPVVKFRMNNTQLILIMIVVFLCINLKINSIVIVASEDRPSSHALQILLRIPIRNAFLFIIHPEQKQNGPRKLFLYICP